MRTAVTTCTGVPGGGPLVFVVLDFWVVGCFYGFRSYLSARREWIIGHVGLGQCFQRGELMSLAG